MTTGFITSGAVDVDTLLEPRKNWQFPSNLWVWGVNTLGQLGTGTASSVNSPVQLGSFSEWKSLDLSRAIKSDGTLWAWGDGFAGGLGLGDTTSRSSPVQVGALSNWKQVSTINGSTMAVKTDGTLWGWGLNTSGQLGLSDATSRSSPVQVGALTDWLVVSPGGLSHFLAIKTDGTLWAWGTNTTGQLGLGDTTTRSSPVKVGALTNWKRLVEGPTNNGSSFAIKTDGTLWAWGDNSSGQLGLGDATARSSPVQVGLLTNWRQLALGRPNPGVVAVKTDGTLWAWGYGNDGQLGLGDTAPRSSPVQVGALTTWSVVAASVAGFRAIKTDGTLWTWGSNTNGQLGLGVDTNHKSSPVQVGSLAIWKLPTFIGALTF